LRAASPHDSATAKPGNKQSKARGRRSTRALAERLLRPSWPGIDPAETGREQRSTIWTQQPLRGKSVRSPVRNPRRAERAVRRGIGAGLKDATSLPATTSWPKWSSLLAAGPSGGACPSISGAPSAMKVSGVLSGDSLCDSDSLDNGRREMTRQNCAHC
jgi:hypothetical protein